MAGTDTEPNARVVKAHGRAMGKELMHETDFNVLCGMLTELGWRKIILKPMPWETGASIDAWTAQYIKGPFETMGLVWMFEREEDANWFALKWL